MDFTRDQDKICKFIKTTSKTYGGDADECYELVLNNARVTMDWEAGRTKVFVMIGDASPHSVSYPDNKLRIDWANEAGLLKDLGVKIFAVHALSYYRGGSRKFYESIANITGGKYLTLDQFDEVVDLIKATCIAEYSEKKLNEFVSVIRHNGRMTKTMATNLGRLSGKSYEPELKKVQRDGLVPVKPGRFQVMTVPVDCAIKGFVEDNGITFKRGRGFYELSKHETVQQYKEIIIQDRETGEMFTGAQVRERLGLQPQVDKGGVKESLSSRDTAEFRVFVQSTSFNRKLIEGTTFLYEIEDIEDKGTTISESTVTKEKVEEAKEVKTVKKDKTKNTAKKETTKPKKAVKAEKSEKSSKMFDDLPIIPSEFEIKSSDTKESEKKAKKASLPTKRTLSKHMNKLIDCFNKLESLKGDEPEVEEALNETIKALEASTKLFSKYC